MPFAVLQKHLEKLTGPKLAPLVEMYRELMVTVGTRRQASEVRGILVENLTEERANLFASDLRAVGVDIEVREMAQLVPNPPPQQIRSGGCSSEGFKQEDLYGRERVHPWDTILLMCVGKVMVEETELRRTSTAKEIGKGLMREVASYGVMGSGYGPPGILKPTNTRLENKVKNEPHFILDIYVGRDASHYRIIADKFNYSYLGSRVASSSAENFKQMLADFGSNATQALRNQWFEPLVSLRLSTLNAYSNLWEFDEENRWWLQKADVSY